MTPDRIDHMADLLNEFADELTDRGAPKTACASRTLAAAARVMANHERDIVAQEVAA